MNNELYHHGILGMKWGVRRYQNADGSLTALGRKRLGYSTTDKKVADINAKATARIKTIKQDAKNRSRIEKAQRKANTRIAKAQKKYGVKNQNGSAKEKTKPISEMTDEEIRAKINRIKLENELKSLNPKYANSGKSTIQKFLKEKALPLALSEGEKFLKKALDDALANAAKSEHQTSKEKLQSEVELLELKARKGAALSRIEAREAKEKRDKKG